MAGVDEKVNSRQLKTVMTAKFDAGGVPLALAFSPDGTTLYSAGDDNLIRRWDVEAGKQTGVFKGHDGAVVSLFAQGDAVISGGLDRTMRIWDAENGQAADK